MKSFLLFCIGSVSLFQIRNSIKQNKKTKTKRQTHTNEKQIDGIVFGETGVNFAYQLGIAKYIQTQFNTNNYKMGGISGGCQCAFLLANDINVELFFNDVIVHVFQEKNKNFKEVFELTDKQLRQFFKLYGSIEKMRNKLFICITRLFPYIHNHTAYNFKTYSDLYGSLKASQYIPLVFGNWCTKYHDTKCIDGFVSCLGYKPTNEKWITLKLYHFSYYYYCTGVICLFKLFDVNYHKRLYKEGYNDAQKRHDYFLKLGFVEKNNELS